MLRDLNAFSACDTQPPILGQSWQRYFFLLSPDLFPCGQYLLVLAALVEGSLGHAPDERSVDPERGSEYEGDVLLR